MRFHLHQRIAGIRVLDPGGFPAASEAEAIAHARATLVDLQRSFPSAVSVELEDANGRSILMLFDQPRETEHRQDADMPAHWTEPPPLR